MIDYPIALVTLLSYFILIGALVWRISPQLKQSLNNNTTQVLTFWILAAISLLATWTYMVRFFAWSYATWRSTADYKYVISELGWLNKVSYWLHDVSLFDSAWREVSVGAWQWLLSHQLCSLTVAVWTPILAIEGARRRIPYVWAYMLLGQVVAISVASSLFFAVMLSSPAIVNKHPSEKLIKTVAVSSVGGILTVIISPYVASSYGFMPNLLVMHILLILPLANLKSKFIELPAFSSIKTPLYISALYLFAAGANFSIYFNQWLQCLASLEVNSNSFIYDIGYMIISTFFGHPAQSSISFDVVCMQFISITWMYLHRDTTKGNNYLIALTPLLSASVTLPLHFALKEYQKLK